MTFGVRIAHCSDLHLLHLDGVRWLQYASKRWIGRANLLTNRSRHYLTPAFEDMVADINALAGADRIDHLVCTGDVTNIALAGEFANARRYFDQLTLGPTHVTVMPGNHDTYVAEGVGLFAEAFADYFTPDDGWAWPEDAAAAKRDRRVAPHWPVVRVRGEVAIIALSTSLATPWFTAYGRLGALQLERLRAVLTDPRLAGKVRLVALHHPPAGKRGSSRIRGLRDHAALAEVIRDCGADLIIHGHEHRNMHEGLASPSGEVAVLGVPSGTYAADDTNKTARYRVIEVEAGRIVGHHLRIWRAAERRFERDDAEPVPVPRTSPVLATA